MVGKILHFFNSVQRLERGKTSPYSLLYRRIVLNFLSNFKQILEPTRSFCVRLLRRETFRVAALLSDLARNETMRAQVVVANQGMCLKLPHHTSLLMAHSLARAPPSFCTCTRRATTRRLLAQHTRAHSNQDVRPGRHEQHPAAPLPPRRDLPFCSSRNRSEGTSSSPESTHDYTARIHTSCPRSPRRLQ